MKSRKLDKINVRDKFDVVATHFSDTDDKAPDQLNYTSMNKRTNEK